MKAKKREELLSGLGCFVLLLVFGFSCVAIIKADNRDTAAHNAKLKQSCLALYARAKAPGDSITIDVFRPEDGRLGYTCQRIVREK